MNDQEQWEGIAAEAIADAAYWKKKARKYEKLLFDHIGNWEACAIVGVISDWEPVNKLCEKTRKELRA